MFALFIFNQPSSGDIFFMLAGDVLYNFSVGQDPAVSFHGLSSWLVAGKLVYLPRGPVAAAVPLACKPRAVLGERQTKAFVETFYYFLFQCHSTSSISSISSV